MDNDEPLIEFLSKIIPAPGEVRWIGIRPHRGEPVVSVDEVVVDGETGLAGDHFHGTKKSRRHVTLIQAEHLEAVGSFLGRGPIDPSIVRRNIVVSGINLYSIRNRLFRIGDVELEGTGLCHPCRNMESALGEGGYNAMRGHGGLTARVVHPGTIRVGDSVEVIHHAGTK